MTSGKVLIISRDDAYLNVMEQYVGKTCIYCEHKLQSASDAIERNIVNAGRGRIACQSCWNKAHPTKDAPNP